LKVLFLAREEGAALGSLVLETNAGGFIVKVCLSPPAASPVTTPNPLRIVALIRFGCRLGVDV